MKFKGNELPQLPSGFEWELMDNEPWVRAPDKNICCWINTPDPNAVIKGYEVVEATWANDPCVKIKSAFNYVYGFTTMDDAIAYVVQAINIGVIS